MNHSKNLILTIFIIYASIAQAQVGNWSKDEVGLPLFVYKGGYPFVKKDENGKLLNQYNDPYSILGNYMLTVFAHASGKYQLITGERTWARLNMGDTLNRVQTESGGLLRINNEEVNLIGKASEVRFGTGFAAYDYNVKNLKITRIFSTLPSREYNDGTAAMKISVSIKNTSGKVAAISYTEWIRANFENYYQIHKNVKKVDYQNQISIDKAAGVVVSKISATPREPMLWRDKDQFSEYDGFPPLLFLQTLNKEKANISTRKDPKGYDNLLSSQTLSLKSGEEKIIEFIVGFTYENSSIESLTKSLQAKGTFRNEWKNRLPDFKNEPDDSLRAELVWNTYVLHCMATYSDYFKETKIPLGACYDYVWGMHVCTRDHAQLALPMMYYDKDLAKSVLRYVLKRLNAKGELHMAEHGYGFVSHGTLFGSDNQLYPLWAIGEWLRITKDSDFLLETTDYYPMNSGAKGSTLDKIEAMFLYLRDEVRTGKRGLVRNLNSDWSDDVHFVSANAPFNRNFENSESNTNTAMAISTLKTLADELEKCIENEKFKSQKERLQTLISAIRVYRQNLLNALKKELEGRNFLTAYHFYSTDWGADKIFLLPNAFALQIPELGKDKKSVILTEIENRILKSEKLGARNREEPQTDGMHYAMPGTGENGGFWWCPNAQLILGVNAVDKTKAQLLFKKASFQNQSKQFPNYWTGYWTASDYIHSSISDSEGASNNWPFCSLPHAFKIYTYFKLKE